MKELFITLFLIISYLNILAQESIMLELRKLFDKATVSESYVSKAEVFMCQNTEQVPFHSYRSMLFFIKAQYRFNPYSKLSDFKKGKEKMEQAVLLYPNDIETRFLRLAVQTKVPSFLAYNSNKKNDKIFIENNYSEIKDKDLKRRIKLFFIENKILTKEEINKL